MSVTGSNGITGYGSAEELIQSLQGPGSDDPRNQVPPEGYVPLHRRLQEAQVSLVPPLDPLSSDNLG